MRAVVIDQFGPPEVLAVKEIADPRPAPGQVLIHVQACGVNRRDTWVRAGLRNRELPRILGCDIAGKVVDLGSGCDGALFGSDVVCYPVVSCRRCRACGSGDDHLCAATGLLGAETDGGYCELIALDERQVFAAPRSLEIAEAAALPIVYTTASQMIRRTRVRPGDRVLVWGASGALGGAVLDLCKLRRPGLLVTTASNEKLDRVPEGGDVTVIPYDREDVVQRVLELTDGEGVDVVLDHVGSETWSSDLAVLAKGGRLAIAGATTGQDAEVGLLQFLTRGLEVHGCFVGSRADFSNVLRLADRGLIQPAIEKMPLENAIEAHRRLEQGENYGKLVLTTI